MKMAIFPLLFPLLFSLLFPFALSTIPNAELLLSDGSTVSYLSMASFGSKPAEDQETADWLQLLTPITSIKGCEDEITVQNESGFILVLERGDCSFEQKSKAGENAGASAVIIVNNIESVYAERYYGDDKVDYECENGSDWLDIVKSPPWSDENDTKVCSSDSKCQSEVCMLTNTTYPSLGTKVCCAWDIFLTMGGTSNSSTVTIPSLFMSMKEGKELFGNPDFLKQEVKGKIYLRYEPLINVSSILIWLLGVVTAMTSSHLSTKSNGTNSKRAEEAESDDQTIDLTMAHTLGFILFASTTLIVLFFFDLNKLVTILYCVSAGTATATVLAIPILRYLRFAEGKIVSIFLFGPVLLSDAVAVVVSYSLTVYWLLIRDVSVYDFILQDVFGCCLCVVFLSSLRLPSLKVAAALLSMAFFYDIFWVFISPLLFSDSVMVVVATGGGSTVDPEICEKYPKTDGCIVSSLPMLLKLPRIGGYQQGSVMLGLGDIVLPGLLISFCCRYDQLLRIPSRKGYFLLVSIGYAVGLMLANLAVIVSNLGQPALLYIVPCTLGIVCLVAWVEGTLNDLWNGPFDKNSWGNDRSNQRYEDGQDSSLLYNL